MPPTADPLEGWPEQFTASAARDFLNERIGPWAELTGRELGEFRLPTATGLGQDAGLPDELAASGEVPSNEDREAMPWFPELAYWAFAPPPRGDRLTLNSDPGGVRANQEPLANLISCAAWVARRQRVLDRLRRSGNLKLVRLLNGLQETLESLAADSPELVTEPAYTAALVAASQLAPLVATRTPSPSLERGVRADDVPTKLAWVMLTHGGLSTRLATVTVVALGLEGDEKTPSVSSYVGLRERLRKMHRRDEYLPAANAHLSGARFAPGPVEALELFGIYGRLEAQDTVGLKKCFVVDQAAMRLGREHGELRQALSVIGEVFSSSGDALSVEAANSVPLADIADLVEQARRRHGTGRISVAELVGTTLGRIPGAAVAWLLGSRASLSGHQVAVGVALVLEVAELFGEGVALDFLSRALPPLGEPPSA